MAVSFIGGGNWRKPPTCLKSLTNFIALLLKVALNTIKQSSKHTKTKQTLL
jgi:hypothetical protein